MDFIIYKRTVEVYRYIVYIKLAQKRLEIMDAENYNIYEKLAFKRDNGDIIYNDGRKIISGNMYLVRLDGYRVCEVF